MHVFAQQQKVQNKHHHKKSKRDAAKMKKSSSSPSHLQAMCVSDDEGEDEGTAGGLASLSIQLLDLMHTLHTRAATIFTSWAEEEQSSEERESIDACHSALWIKCWCPLLQGEDLDNYLYMYTNFLGLFVFTLHRTSNQCMVIVNALNCTNLSCVYVIIVTNVHLVGVTLKVMIMMCSVGLL